MTGVARHRHSLLSPIPRRSLSIPQRRGPARTNGSVPLKLLPLSLLVALSLPRQNRRAAFPKPESTNFKGLWIPSFAGMMPKTRVLFHRPSRYSANRIYSALPANIGILSDNFLIETPRQPTTNSAGQKTRCLLVRQNSGSPTLEVIGVLTNIRPNFTKLLNLFFPALVLLYMR